MVRRSLGVLAAVAVIAAMGLPAALAQTTGYSPPLPSEGSTEFPSPPPDESEPPITPPAPEPPPEEPPADPPADPPNTPPEDPPTLANTGIPLTTAAGASVALIAAGGALLGFRRRHRQP